MQFYLDGYKPGDPTIADPHPSVAARGSRLPQEVDVLIVGTGPAGAVLGAQLANFPDISTAIVERRPRPLELGQADGVACRTVEMFETFGLARRLVDEAYWVNETCFWQPDPEDPTRIKRTGRVRDTDPDTSEFPHVIVNQARMLAYLLDYMAASPTRLAPFYSLHVTDLEVDTTGASEYPVTVTMRQLDADYEPTGEMHSVRAKYVVGCDGSHSTVRTAIGRELNGDAKNMSWGVMDVLSSTDFPDIRFKCTIQSAANGSIVMIPREGGFLNRFYVELGGGRDREMLENHEVTPEKLAEVANRIMHPYTLDVREVGWWSVYEIGQRLTDKFDDVPLDETEERLPRVFIAGDACHTHSAKAGQGMNVSMADTFNLGWKLVSVLRGLARPELLHTYSDERQKVAQELIDYDEEWTRILATPLRNPGEPESDGIEPEEFQRYFATHTGYTAGVINRYSRSLLTAEPRFQHLAEGFQIGMRFHSAPVIRLADAKPVQLGHVARADAAWRLYVFADRAAPNDPNSKARALFHHLASDASPIARFTPTGAAPDSVIDVRGIFQQSHHDLTVESLPAVLLPRKGRLGLIDYEKAFCPDPASDIFDRRGVDRDGCMVLVRPDQYISDVLPLDAEQALIDFLGRILLDVAVPEHRGRRHTGSRLA